MSHEKALEARITEYLSLGGLFNPEQMDHEKVRDLLIDCRAYLSAIVPDEVAGVVERLLRERKVNLGNIVAVRALLEDVGADAGEAAYLLTALAARTEKAERELSGLAQVCVDGGHTLADAHIRITTLEAENAALRARLEKAGKVIGPFAAIYERCIPEEPELRGPILNAKPDEKALVFPLVHDLRAAHRFLEEAK